MTKLTIAIYTPKLLRSDGAQRRFNQSEPSAGADHMEVKESHEMTVTVYKEACFA